MNTKTLKMIKNLKNLSYTKEALEMIDNIMSQEPDVLYINKNTPLSIRNIKKIYNTKRRFHPSPKLQKMMKIRRYMIFIGESGSIKSIFQEAGSLGAKPIQTQQHIDNLKSTETEIRIELWKS